MEGLLGHKNIRMWSVSTSITMLGSSWIDSSVQRCHLKPAVDRVLKEFVLFRGGKKLFRFYISYLNSMLFCSLDSSEDVWQILL